MPVIDHGVARSARTRAAVYVTVLLLLGGLFLIRKTLFVFVIASMFAYLLYPSLTPSTAACRAERASRR